MGMHPINRHRARDPLQASHVWTVYLGALLGYGRRMRALIACTSAVIGTLVLAPSAVAIRKKHKGGPVKVHVDATATPPSGAPLHAIKTVKVT